MAPSLADLIKRNEANVATYESIPTLDELRAGGNALPTTCFISCADPRIIPEQIFNLSRGEAFIFRTIAGHPQPVVNDIIGIDLFNKFEDVVVLHHTDCGARVFPVDKMREDLEKDFPSASREIKEMSFGKISTSIEDNLREDVKWLKGHPLVREQLSQAIKAYMFDIKTGRLHKVE